MPSSRQGGGRFRPRWRPRSVRTHPHPPISIGGSTGRRCPAALGMGCAGALTPMCRPFRATLSRTARGSADRPSRDLPRYRRSRHRPTRRVMNHPVDYQHRAGGVGPFGQRRLDQCVVLEALDRHRSTWPSRLAAALLLEGAQDQPCQGLRLRHHGCVRGRHLLDPCVPTLGHESLTRWRDGSVLGAQQVPRGWTAIPAGPRAWPPRRRSRVAGSPPSPRPSRGRRRRRTSRKQLASRYRSTFAPVRFSNGTGRSAAGTRLSAKASASRNCWMLSPSSGIHSDEDSACTCSFAAAALDEPRRRRSGRPGQSGRRWCPAGPQGWPCRRSGDAAGWLRR